MTEWPGTLEQRNAHALREFRYKWESSLYCPDAWRPMERQYLDYVMGLKLEAARSFLDRLKYTRREWRTMLIAARIARPL